MRDRQVHQRTSSYRNNQGFGSSLLRRKPTWSGQDENCTLSAGGTSRRRRGFSGQNAEGPDILMVCRCTVRCIYGRVPDIMDSVCWLCGCDEGSVSLANCKFRILRCNYIHWYRSAHTKVIWFGHQPSIDTVTLWKYFPRPMYVALQCLAVQ